MLSYKRKVHRTPSSVNTLEQMDSIVDRPAKAGRSRRAEEPPNNQALANSLNYTLSLFQGEERQTQSDQHVTGPEISLALELILPQRGVRLS